MIPSMCVNVLCVLETHILGPISHVQYQPYVSCHIWKNYMIALFLAFYKLSVAFLTNYYLCSFHFVWYVYRLPYANMLQWSVYVKCTRFTFRVTFLLSPICFMYSFIITLFIVQLTCWFLFCLEEIFLFLRFILKCQ